MSLSRWREQPRVRGEKTSRPAVWHYSYRVSIQAVHITLVQHMPRSQHINRHVPCTTAARSTDSAGYTTAS